MQGLIDPLAALRDIHLPPQPSWWPPAGGWWWLMVALLLLAALLFGLYQFWHYRRYRLRRDALRTLATLRERYQQGEAMQPLCAELSCLLKSIAVLRFPDDSVAGLIGRPWLEFLDRSTDSSAFTRGCGLALISAPYQSTPRIDIEALLDLSEQWVRGNT